jgi:DEAD/DEAH box helicase
MPKKQLGMILAEYLAIVRPLEVFYSEKFKCKGGADLNEFMWADHKNGLWTSDFISDLLKCTTSRRGMHGLGFREYRQVAAAFMEHHLKYKMDDPDDKNVNAVFDMQAGHSSRTAGVHYAVTTEDHGQVSLEAMHKYFLVSRQWEVLLLEQRRSQTQESGVMESGSGVTKSGVDDSGVNDSARSPVMRWSEVRGEDGLELSARALHALRGLYGDPEAEFKSGEQADAVRSALQRETDVLAILPTGGGKSAAFMAPAWLETQLTTVVIVPFVALIEEMEGRCVKQGISCYIWRNSSITQRMAQVVLVGVENASSVNS